MQSDVKNRNGRVYPQPILAKEVAKYNKNFIMLKFEDNGVGIPTEIIDKIYEPYVTSKKTGTGLGLAIVNKIIEEHAGDIEIKNTKPNGVCILITLPLVEIKNG